VTHTFVGDDPYLASDTVFGVKETLVAPFKPNLDGTTQWVSKFDFILMSES